MQLPYLELERRARGVRHEHVGGEQLRVDVRLARRPEVQELVDAFVERFDIEFYSDFAAK